LICCGELDLPEDRHLVTNGREYINNNNNNNNNNKILDFKGITYVAVS
jgi:hypothetical protein